MTKNKTSNINLSTIVSKCKLLCILFGISSIVSCISCSDNPPVVEDKTEDKNNGDNNVDKPNEPDKDDDITLKPEDIEDYHKIYKPLEFKDIDFFSKDAKWSFVRSKQSEHFIVFWELGFGDNPNAYTIHSDLRVDIDDMLIKMEEFYDMNVNKLGFAETGIGKSNLDKYKMQVYLHYTREWMAYGAGYDDVIGAIWVSPGTCKPVGSTIAHEIGHSFQYQVYVDLINYYGVPNDFKRGFRYNPMDGNGNGFWEQCAQWQAFQNYPQEIFNNYHFEVYSNNYHRNICHEYHRYASYFIHYHWTDKHGIDFIGKLWREAEYPEDAIEAYMRINNYSVEELNDDLYEAATRFATWDYNAIRSYGQNYIGKHTYKLYHLPDGYYQVSYDKCPGTTGYNVIPLNVGKAGTVITTEFTGLLPGSALADSDPGVYIDYEKQYTKRTYNNGQQDRSGWRYGYVALLENGERVYGEMHKEHTSSVSFTIPENCKNLWFVVVGAPNSYIANKWDETESQDDQWPYKVKFSNTDILGNISIDPESSPEDIALSYKISFAAADSYDGTSIILGGSDDMNAIAQALVMQPSEIAGIISAPGTNPTEGKISFGALLSDKSIEYNTTANGYGFWFNSNGNVVTWGENNDSKIFIEFYPDNFEFKIGQFPNKSKPGDKFKITNVLVYTKNNQQYTVSLSFEITLS